jgi:hypothetical protein
MRMSDLTFEVVEEILTDGSPVYSLRIEDGVGSIAIFPTSSRETAIAFHHLMETAHRVGDLISMEVYK